MRLQVRSLALVRNLMACGLAAASLCGTASAGPREVAKANVALFDKTTPSPPLWAPFPLIESFCSLILESGAPMVIGHAQGDERSGVRDHTAAATVQFADTLLRP